MCLTNAIEVLNVFEVLALIRIPSLIIQLMDTFEFFDRDIYGSNLLFLNVKLKKLKKEINLNSLTSIFCSSILLREEEGSCMTNNLCEIQVINIFFN